MLIWELEIDEFPRYCSEEKSCFLDSKGLSSYGIEFGRIQRRKFITIPAGLNSQLKKMNLF